MSLPNPLRWIRRITTGKGRTARNLRLQALETREVPNGYVAIGAGPGTEPMVAIRVDIHDSLGGSPPNSLGQPATPRSDGQTDLTSQIFMPFAPGFRGGVHTATGNFDGLYSTPDSLVTAAGPGGGPHVIVWNMMELPDGRVVTNGIRDQFFAFDPRFRGGVNVTTGDLDGDGRAELITAAGPGGGPHVRIWKEINGHFQLANEFFAFDPGFRGGVNVASGQGYKTLQQQRLVLNAQAGGFTPVGPVQYAAQGIQLPGSANQVPLTGLDSFVPPGDSVGFGPGSGYISPNGVPGHFDATGFPLPYVTVASGYTQYLSGNLLNSYGNNVYRPDIFVSPNVGNPTGTGNIVFASWTTSPPAGFLTGVTYGPFVQLNATTVTLLTPPPDAVTFVNDLVVAAGPGGGPHVKIYQFAGLADGSMQNLGSQKEFFAFDASFRGGVNVAVNDVVANPGANKIPGRLDFASFATTGTIPFIPDTNANSGSQAFTNFPYDTRLFEKYQPDILVGMESGGSEVRVFSDAVPIGIDSAVDSTVRSASSFPVVAPVRRTALDQLNLQPFSIDLALGIDPNNPLQNYTGFHPVQGFTRAIDAGFTGGVNVAVASLQFDGSAQTSYYGFGTVGGGARLTTNPVLGHPVFGAGMTPPGQSSRGARVRIFGDLSTYLPTNVAYNPIDDFQAFLNDPFTQGASVSFGFGVLPEPGVDVTYANYTYANASAGLINSTAANPIPVTPVTVMTVTDPVLA